jgi:lysophospholipase L1-like esterase
MKNMNLSPLFSIAGVFAVLIGLPGEPISGAETSVTAPQPLGRQAVTIRGDLDRSRSGFATSGRGTVVFMGGSITEMDGYRPMVCQALRTRFPETEFNFVNAGISSTCSHTGAFRMPTDILAHQPDLLLVEFAVNDDQDAAHDYDQAVRGMEGIVRAARIANPNIDILITHFVNPSMLETIQRGDVPTSIRAHETVAKHYGVSTCNVAVELARQIAAGETTWQRYGGVHPKPAGNRIAADLVQRVFEAVDFAADFATGNDAAKPAASSAKRPLPPPIDEHSFDAGRFLDAGQIRLGENWQRRIPDWENLPGSFRKRFAGRPLTVADQPGAELEIRFRGDAIGVYVLAGPDAGAVDVSVDGDAWQTVDLYHRYSKGLHYPRTVVLRSGMPATGPAGTQHRVKLRVSTTKNDASEGHAVRVLEFVAN